MVSRCVALARQPFLVAVAGPMSPVLLWCFQTQDVLAARQDLPQGLPAVPSVRLGDIMLSAAVTQNLSI